MVDTPFLFFSYLIPCPKHFSSPSLPFPLTSTFLTPLYLLPPLSLSLYLYLSLSLSLSIYLSIYLSASLHISTSLPHLLSPSVLPNISGGVVFSPPLPLSPSFTPSSSVPPSLPPPSPPFSVLEPSSSLAFIPEGESGK